MDTRAVTYEDYVAMCGCVPVMGLDGMLAHYRLSMAEWAQVSTNWNAIVSTNAKYAQHATRVEQEAQRIRSGGAPKPVSADPPAALAQEAPLHAVSGAMPGAVPPPAYRASPLAVSGGMPGAMPPPGYGAPPPGYAAAPPGYPSAPPPPPGYAAGAPPGYNQPPPGYGAAPPPPPGYGAAPPPPPPGYGAAPPPGYGPAGPVYPGSYPPPPGYGPPQAPQGPMQPGYSSPRSHADDFEKSVGNALGAFGSALGSLASSVTGAFANNAPVLVQWSDGQRYPATVVCSNAGQVQVAFPDGRKAWIPSQYVFAR